MYCKSGMNHVSNAKKLLLLLQQSYWLSNELCLNDMQIYTYEILGGQNNKNMNLPFCLFAMNTLNLNFILFITHKYKNYQFLMIRYHPPLLQNFLVNLISRAYLQESLLLREIKRSITQEIAQMCKLLLYFIPISFQISVLLLTKSITSAFFCTFG